MQCRYRAQNSRRLPPTPPLVSSGLLLHPRPAPVKQQEVWAEMLASSAYDTSVVSEGRGSTQFLQDMPTRSASDSNDSINGSGDVCCQVPIEVFDENEAPDTTMFGTTSLQSFCRLVHGVEIDCIVKVLYKHKADRKVGHLVVVGPGGFQLCTCLQLLRRGLQCRHVLAALVTQLKRSGELKGESIHPRWRSSVEPWSLENVGLATFDGDGDGSYDGGFTGDWLQCGNSEDLPGDNSPDPVLSVLRGRAFANLTELCNRAVRTYTDSMTRESTTADQSMFGDLMRHVNDFVHKRRSGDTEQSSSSFKAKDPPVTKSRRHIRSNDCLEEGGKAKKTKIGPMEN